MDYLAHPRSAESKIQTIVVVQVHVQVEVQVQIHDQVEAETWFSACEKALCNKAA